MSVTHGPDGLVRITLKRAFADGTVAVERDGLAPRQHDGADANRDVRGELHERASRPAGKIDIVLGCATQGGVTK